MRKVGAITRYFFLLVGAILFATPDARAQSDTQPRLTLPVACTPGQDCFILRYMDVDPSEGRRDFACGVMSNDKHKGTDIALTHDGLIADNVPVLAAADGRVAGVRDSMEDVNIRLSGGPESVKGKECGNGVRIDHGGGWTTQYCHLRKGSLIVRRGDQVVAGQALGAIGMSGLSEYAHVHLTVSKGKKPVDPFQGLSTKPGHCGIGPAPLWDEKTLAGFRYDAGLIYHAGFADRVPKPQEARAGELETPTITRSAPVMVFWFEIAGQRPGDELSYALLGPDGSVIAEKTETMKRFRLREWRLIGRKARGPWPPGDYKGTVSWKRSAEPGAGAREIARTLTID